MIFEYFCEKFIMINLKSIIDKIWDDKSLLSNKNFSDAVIECIDILNKGEVRVCNFVNNKWEINEWLKKAILLYFRLSPTKYIKSGDLKFYDKVPLKDNFEDLQVRAVPTAIARHGSYIAPNVVLMPSFVNIGAYIDSGTMVDTWATVGSCAQIGKNVHLSGGVGIGGVLEPLQASPVIIEDDCFIGSRCIVVEGALISKLSVIGANTVITASTHIIDITGEEPITYKGFVPPNSIVIPGTRDRKFPSGTYPISCAYIIGKRSTSTDKKTSLNETLRMI
jgi:2,3,4,5-tetrahydropyridine-2-carboxylate N-succinyltransferase